MVFTSLRFGIADKEVQHFKKNITFALQTNRQ